ncbi:MAG: ribokinase [Candidatus Izemoplasmatales bacterium]
MKKLFVLGSINMDFIFKVDQMPSKGQTISGKGFSNFPGGKGANQAVAAAKQGAKTYMIGNVGNDIFGSELIEKLVSYHVETDFVKQLSDTSSGTACILLEDNDNRIITYGGANHIHDIKEVEDILNQNASADDTLLMQLEIPLDVIKKALEIAKDKGMQTVLNAAPMKKLNSDVLSLVDLLIVNESETKALTDLDVDDTNIDQAFEIIKTLGPKKCIITLGDKGSYYKEEDRIIYTKVYISEIVDTTGAGDAFIGIFLANKMMNIDTETALKRATAGASITIETMGAQNAIPTKLMIDDFLDREES